MRATDQLPCRFARCLSTATNANATNALRNTCTKFVRHSTRHREGVVVHIRSRYHVGGTELGARNQECSFDTQAPAGARSI